MDEPVDGGDGHRGIGEDRVPRAEWLVGGDKDRAAFVAGADQLEQHRGLGLALLDVGQIVENEQAVLVELLDGGGELQVLAGGRSQQPSILDDVNPGSSSDLQASSSRQHLRSEGTCPISRRCELSGASPGQLAAGRSGEYSNATTGTDYSASDTSRASGRRRTSSTHRTSAADP